MDAEEKIYIHQTPIITKDQIFTHLLWNGICSSQYSRLFLIATSNCNVTDNVAVLPDIYKKKKYILAHS